MMPKVSVIIPVFNGETYLAECLDSVCQQTLFDIEILCIDDGSTDSSLRILKEYMKKDKRIQVIEQGHRGLAASRNRGIGMATGEYLALWDCDDYFSRECLTSMYEKSKLYQADLCVCGVNHHYMDMKCLIPSPKHLRVDMLPNKVSFSAFDIPQYILNFSGVSVWNKLYRREFIEKNEIRFGKVVIGEDISFTSQVLVLSESIVTVPEFFVNYRSGQGNSLVDHIADYPLEIINAWIETESILKHLGRFPESSFRNFAIENILFLLQRISVWETMRDAIYALKNGGLDRLHISNDSEYYNPFHQKCVEHLINDSPEGFLMFLLQTNHKKLHSARIALELKNVEIEKLCLSTFERS